MVSKSGYGCGMSVSMHCTDDTIGVQLHGPVSSGSHPVTVQSCGQSVTLFLTLGQVEFLANAMSAYVQDQQRQTVEPDGYSEAAQRVMS